jgi:hypothetical protein
MLVEVVEFVRPDGRQKNEKLEVANDCAVGYEAMQRKGCRLTAELIINAVSCCIEHPEGDFSIVVVANGPLVRDAYEAMLRKFDGAVFDKWLACMRDTSACPEGEQDE